MKRVLIIFMIILLCVPLLNAVSIGTFEKNKDIQLYQTCNNCTYCNFTFIKYPNSTTILSNVETIKDGTYFYYNLAGGNTSSLGDYEYCYDCGNAIEKATGCIDFTITPNGQELTEGQAIINVFLTLMFFGLVILFFYFIVVIPKENEKNSRGDDMRIVKMKYIRIFFIAITYPLIIILLNLMNGLANNFSTLSMFSGTLGFLFEVLLKGAWIWTLIMILWLLYKAIQDSNVSKNINKIGRFKLNEQY